MLRSNGVAYIGLVASLGLSSGVLAQSASAQPAPSAQSAPSAKASSAKASAKAVVPVAMVTTTAVNVRSGPSASTSAVTWVKANTRLTGTVTNGWLKISSPSQFAGRYVSARYVKPADASSVIVNDVINVHTNVRLSNVRTGPSVNAPLSTTIPMNTKLTGTVTNGWLAIASPKNLAGRYISMNIVTRDVVPVPTTPTTPTTPSPTNPGIPGIDVSNYTTQTDFGDFKKAGKMFAIAKISEGEYYTNPKYAAQKVAAARQGMAFAPYIFMNPATSTGEAHIDFALSKGASWSRNTNGQLPFMLDYEWNPYKSVAGGDMCFGMSQGQMKAHIVSAENAVKAKTGSYAGIYTAPQWWNKCVGTMDVSSYPLWDASYTTKPVLPRSWSKATFWQTGASSGYDTDIFLGSVHDLWNLGVKGF